MKPLTIALPKGRLLEPAVALFRRLGYACPLDQGSRQLLVEDHAGRVQYLLAKASDVAIYVEYGAADLGIVGQDILLEGGRDVYEPLPLGFGRCRLVLAGVPPYRGRDLGLLGSVRVATRYPNLTRAHFRHRGVAVEIVYLSGSIELAPSIGLADLVVDVVETGRTLRENGLVELAEVARCQATMVVNRVALRLRRAEIHRLLTAIRNAGGAQ